MAETTRGVRVNWEALRNFCEEVLGAASDLRAEASAPYLIDEEYGFLKASCGNAVDAVRIIEYVGALEILHLAGAQTQYKPGKEPAHE